LKAARKQVSANISSRFHLFFNQIDNYKETHFMYLTSKGIEATKGAGKLDEQRAVNSKNDGADAMEMQ
jgi:tRNA pseudouridine38-40 synthase